jgi:hypothetical protein
MDNTKVGEYSSSEVVMITSFPFRPYFAMRVCTPTRTWTCTDEQLVISAHAKRRLLLYLSPPSNLGFGSSSSGVDLHLVSARLYCVLRGVHS